MQLDLDSQPSLYGVTSHAISVGDLNRLAKQLIERNLPLLWVAGEISNFMRSASGHSYFSLKDGQAQVRCVMFGHKMRALAWKPENGMQVEVRACPSFYEARGEFQLNVEVMRRSGFGALYEAFEKLKAKLQAEGLFDAAVKVPLPVFPRVIGIVTSIQAAALHDVLTTLRRRLGSVKVIIYPAAVQGEGAGRQIATAIAVADARAECDVLLVCRGGGSIEDLWAFNEEVVARAIYACRLPVVCGIGHETDFTIADFVADARAPTPTAAAQLASPNRDDLCRTLAHVFQRLTRVTERELERRMQSLDVLARRLVHPGARIAAQLGHVGQLTTRLSRAWTYRLEDLTWRLREVSRGVRAGCPDFVTLLSEQKSLKRRLASAMAQRMTGLRAEVKSLSAQLTQLDPKSVLERGYSIVETVSGTFVRDSAQLARDEEVKLTFARGWARARVKDQG